MVEYIDLKNNKQIIVAIVRKIYGDYKWEKGR